MANIADYKKNELLTQIQEFKKQKMMHNYSRMRKEELKTCLMKTFHYRDVAGKTTVELRAMCREHNKKFSIATTRAKKQDLVDCINSQKIELNALPEKITGARQTVDIIVANIGRQYGFSTPIAREYYELRIRAQTGIITEEQRMRKLSLECL